MGQSFDLLQLASDQAATDRALLCMDCGKGENLIFLHGLFGQLSNWQQCFSHFTQNYRVLIPELPLLHLPVEQTHLESLVTYLEQFLAAKGIDRVTLVGNSLGGHLAILFALKNPGKVKRLVLTGSSGLFESGMGQEFPKRGDYGFIEERVRYTFYDPSVASQEMIEEVFSQVNHAPQTLRIIRLAKSANRQYLGSELSKIQAPTLLIWGREDRITPPMVGQQFHQLIPQSELRFINQCGHAPMMERPKQFNRLLEDFLQANP